MHVKRFTACALAAMLAFTPVSPLKVSAEETQDSSLVLYSSFDDETAADESGQGNNGTITTDSRYGTVEFVEGVNGGKAIRIVNDSAHRKTNPAANYVDYGDGLKLGTDDFSVSLWYKTDSEGVSEGDTTNDDHGGNDVSLFGNKDYNVGNNRGLTIGNFSAETPADVRVNFVAKQGTRVEINRVHICDDTWHHLAATFDRDGNMSVYVDGALFSSKSISTYKDLSIDVDGQNFVLGADGVHTYGTPGATVDELRMYRSALSAGQVADLYEQDKPVEPPVDLDALSSLYVTFDDETADDSSSYKTNGTIVGDVQFVDGVKGKAVKISNDADHRKGNKAEQYITFGTQEGVTLGTDDFTLAFWHKSEGHGASDSAIIGNKNYASGSNIGLAVGNYHSSGTNSLNDIRMNISGIQGSRCEVKNISANDDVWHYVVASFDRDGYMNVYVDGYNVGSVSMSSHAGKTVDAGEFVLGADGYFTYGADGCLLDEVRIVRKALNEEQCTTLYQAESLSLKLTEMEELVRLASTEEYSQDSLDAFSAVLENIKAQAGSADTATSAVLCQQLTDAYDTLQAEAREPLLSFDLLSDVHLRDSDSSRAANFIAGLQDIAANHSDSDAFVTLGDNVSFGYDNNSRTQYFDLVEQYLGEIPNKIMILGNHDVRKNDSSSSNGFSSNYDVAYEAYMEDNAIYRDDPDSDKIYFDKWVNGYHFIALNTEEGLKDSIYMSDEQLTWLEEKLGESEDGTAGAADPEKPVFVLVHQALNDTHQRANAYGGFGDQDAQMKEILSNYPQAIVLSGHIHNGFGVATTMDRAYGTLIDIPSYNETEYGVTDNGTGYQVDVYADRVHFRARNYMTSTWLPQYDVILAAPSLPAATALASEKMETASQDDYTAESWSAFTEALTSAQALMDTTNESMRLDVLAATVNLDAAMNALTLTTTDKSDLEALYNQYKDLSSTGYTQATWNIFTAALQSAEKVLNDSEADTEQINTAKEALQAAADGLRASKTTLEYFLNKAKELVSDGVTNDLVESVKQLFTEAITEGDAVMANEKATPEEVKNASLKLMKAIQAQNMKAGDKTDLEMALELADMIDLEQYVTDGQDAFLKAKETAKTVLEDGDAMQGDIDDAWEALTDAMISLRLKADKAALEDLLNSVAELDLSQYTDDSVQAFHIALAAANAVLADETLTFMDQNTVDEAVMTLAAARDALAVKEDGSGETGGDNQNPGTDDTDTGNEEENPESGSAGTGTDSSDESSSDGSNNGSSGSDSNAGSSSAGNSDAGSGNAGGSDKGSDAPKTGDQTNLMLWAVLMVLAGGVCVARRRRASK